MLSTWKQRIFVKVDERLLHAAMKLIEFERNGEMVDDQQVIGVRQSYGGSWSSLSLSFSLSFSLSLSLFLSLVCFSLSLVCFSLWSVSLSLSLVSLSLSLSLSDSFI